MSENTPGGPRLHHGATPPPSSRSAAAGNGPLTAGASVAASNPQLANMMGLPGQPSQAAAPMDFNIPSDIVQLPSEGLWYAHGKGEVLLQNMTSSEENILMDEVRIQNRTQWNDLLGVLIRDPDFLPAGNMLPADFTRCLLQARINSYGDEYSVQVMDPFTGKALEAPYNLIHLSEIRNRPLTHRPDADGLFSFELPMRKQTVRFRLLTNDEYMQLLATHAAQPGQKVTNRLFAQIREVDGDSNRNHINQLVRSMPAGDSARLRLFMDEVEPALDNTMNFVSSTTGNPTFQGKISLNDSIFYF